VLAELECGAEIDINLDALQPTRRPSPRGIIRRSRPRSALSPGDDHIGLLWYAKPVLTAGMPKGLLSYAEVALAYPSTSTLNQFFRTAQLKAYQDLGRNCPRPDVAESQREAGTTHQAGETLAGVASVDKDEWCPGAAHCPQPVLRHRHHTGCARSG
jgi:hypothetical protein